MTSMVVVVLLACSFVVLAVSALPIEDKSSDPPQKCISGAASGVCKKPSNCEWPTRASKADITSEYGCKDGMVCCVAEPHNDRCQRLNSGTSLPNPVEGCCGIERRSAGLGLGAASIDEDRILNGSKSGLYQSPWLVRLLHKGHGRVSTCSGVLVSARHVLTVRHCLEELTGVLLGCPEKLDKHARCELKLVRGKLLRTHQHETLDFGILVLAKAVPYTDLIRPICLPAEEATAGLELRVAGWGRTQVDSPMGSRDKLYTHVPYVPRGDCNDMLKYNNIESTVEAGYMCAGGDGTGRDACLGDSGGALARAVGARHDLVGVVRGQKPPEESVTCGRRGVPTEYVDVFALRDWIEEHVANT